MSSLVAVVVLWSYRAAVADDDDDDLRERHPSTVFVVDDDVGSGLLCHSRDYHFLSVFVVDRELHCLAIVEVVEVRAADLGDDSVEEVVALNPLLHLRC